MGLPTFQSVFMLVPCRYCLTSSGLVSPSQTASTEALIVMRFSATNDSFIGSSQHTHHEVTALLTRRSVIMEDEMNPEDFPAPKDGFVITHFLVVSDQDRSRDFYQKVFDGKVVLERDPVIMKVANTWLILNAGGGTTDDKPTVTLETPQDPNRASAFMNIRVADIKKAYKEWSARGANFLTEPKDHGREIRAYIRDPDGHLIEVGQITARG